jgi:hypothetical protein
LVLEIRAAPIASPTSDAAETITHFSVSLDRIAVRYRHRCTDGRPEPTL